MKIWNRLRQWSQARGKAQHEAGKERAMTMLRAGCPPSYVFAQAETTGTEAFGEGMKEAVREWEAAQVGIYSVMKGRVE